MTTWWCESCNEEVSREEIVKDVNPKHENGHARWDGGIKFLCGPVRPMRLSDFPDTQ